MYPNSKQIRNTCKIHYDLPELKWLQDPPPAKGRRYLNQQEPDTFGLWRNDIKRPAAERFLIPMIEMPAQLMKRLVSALSAPLLQLDALMTNLRTY